MKTKILLLLGAVAGLAATGCAQPFIMIKEAYVPNTEKVARGLIRPVKSAEGAQFSNFYYEICDIGTGRADKCNTTLVLENVMNFNFTHLSY